MSLVRSFGRGVKQQRYAAARRLFLEQLEDRALLHAASGIDTDGAIGHMQWHGETVHVKKGEWIAKFDGISGNPGAQVRALNDLLKDSPLKLKADKQLGQDGVILIKGSTDLGFQEVVAALDDLPGFRLAEPNFAGLHVLATPNDPDFDLLYGLNNTGQTGGTADADIDALEAWDIATGNSSIVVGVIDTGVDYTHPDLAANIWTNTWEAGGTAGIDDDGNGFVDDVHGYDFVNGDGDPYDDHYHGTHVSGTIGAVGNNGVGVAGVNWNAKIMGIKFLDSGGSGSTDGAIAAVNYANMMRNLWVSSGGAKGANIRLTSNSWGGGGYSDLLRSAIADSGTAGLLFVAAAGNGYSDIDSSPFYPASYDPDNLISVAATDHNDLKADFSNWGATSVDLGAPGVDTYSTMPGNSYGYLSGTSMATPHVSGVAALAWSISPTATYQQIRDCLFDGVDLIGSMAGITVTGGRLNAYNAISCVGMAVSGSSPQADAIVSTLPTVFTIDFSHPYDAVPAAAGVFSVNGVPATGVIGLDANTLQFTLPAWPPAALQGVQTMHMDAAAVSAAPGSGLLDPLLKEWNATFLYDAVRMEVVDSDPVDGSAVQLPLDTLVITLNEAVQAASVQASDLQLSQGSVGAPSVSGDGLTITFPLSGVTQEGTLSASIAAGALLDEFGNPNLPFAASYILDIGTLAYPVPLFPIAPKGSLIYDPSASAFINPSSDIDSFTINVDAGQTITVVVTPDSSLRPKVSLLGPGLSVSASAAGAGQDAVVQTAGPTSGGDYTIQVESFDAATTGQFTVQVFLNSAVELESHDGSPNDSRGDAQNIAGSFTPLVKGATRGAVVGQTDGTNPINQVYLHNFESGAGGFTVSNATSVGWHLTTARGNDGGHSPTRSFLFGSDPNRKGAGGSYEVRSKGKSVRNSGSLISPLISLPSGGGLTLDFNYWLETQGSTTRDLAQLEVRVGTSGAWTRLESYNSVAEHAYWATSAPVDVSAYAGQTVQFRWFFDTIDGTANIFRGWQVDDVRILQSRAHDYYAFAATAGQHVSVALEALAGGGSINVQLQDSTGATLTSGQTGQTNVDRMIYDYPLTAGGTYYLAITGATNTSYSLVVTKDAVFDRESNDTLATAQPFGSNQVALGRIGPSVGDILWVGPHSQDWNDGAYEITQITVDQFATQSLNGFDILYVDPDARDSSILQSRAADVAAFVSAGGGLITDDGGNYDAPDFSWTPHGADLAWVVEHQEIVSLTAAGMVHPVTAGLSNAGLSYWGNSQHSYFTATAGLTELATNPSGDPNILAGTYGAGRVVYFGLDPSYHQPTGETVQLLRQATAWVGNPLPEADVYSFVSSGGPLVLFTSTPGDGPGQFSNTLDPTLQLFNSGGAEITGTSEDIDGHNERITYSVPAGTYYVRVSAANGTTGEYILDPVTTADSTPSASSLALLTAPPVMRGASASAAANAGRKLTATSTAANSPLPLVPLGGKAGKGDDLYAEHGAALRHAGTDVTDAVFAQEGSWLKRSTRRRR